MAQRQSFSVSIPTLGAMVFSIFAAIAAMPSSAMRIDTHQHFVPDFYSQKLKELHRDSGGYAIPPWSEESALVFMAEVNITKSIVSISAPGALLTDDARETRLLARRLNQYAHELEQRNPDKFGFFATLTLPDVEGSIEEAKYAIDELGAHGVVLMANTHGTYLGDASLDPLMEVLNERNAVVFVHPDKLPGPALDDIPPFVADFLLDTSRAAANLLRSDRTMKYPNIRYILSHGGGFLPYASYRIAGAVSTMKKAPFPDVMADMKRFYFDTALSASGAALPTLLTFAHDHLLYGSDFPFVQATTVRNFDNEIEKFPGLDPSNRDLLDHAAAHRLFEHAQIMQLQTGAAAYGAESDSNATIDSIIGSMDGGMYLQGGPLGERSAFQ